MTFPFTLTCGQCNFRICVEAESVETARIPPCPRCGQEFDDDFNKAMWNIMLAGIKMVKEKRKP